MCSFLTTEFSAVLSYTCEAIYRKVRDEMNMILTALLYVFVNLLLLKGVSGLLRISLNYIRLLISSVISGIYVLACLLTNNRFLCSEMTCFMVVFIIGFISFGAYNRCWTGLFSYMLLYVALGGLCVKKQAVCSLAIGSLGILLALYVAINGNKKRYIPVYLRYNKRYLTFSALVDTGNLLKDPITGRPVLIVAADIARELTGLSIDQLRSPLDSINLFPGLRLIPYKTVGQSGVFLLGLYVPDLVVGNWKGGGVIALSPECFGSKQTYQALTGGHV